MIIIYKQLIKRYIKNLKKEHIKDFARNNQIYVTDEEVNIIYNFIKEKYQELLDNDNTINELKIFIRKDLYEQIEELYKENKTKYLT